MDDSSGLITTCEAARLVGVSSQNLRVWEQRGLLFPKRTNGGTRLFDAHDVERAREIQRLCDQGGWALHAIKEWAPLDLDPDRWSALSMGMRSREARKWRGLNRRTLAKRADVVERRLAAIERGEEEVSVGALSGWPKRSICRPARSHLRPPRFDAGALRRATADSTRRRRRV